MTTVEKILTDFLIDLAAQLEWNQLVLEIEYQPGMLGFQGYSIDSDGIKTSLRTKPDDRLKKAVRDLHKKTAINEESKWNRLSLVLNRDLTIKRSFTWDGVWQQKIDAANLEHKTKNPDYYLPRWSWQQDNAT